MPVTHRILLAAVAVLCIAAPNADGATRGLALGFFDPAFAENDQAAAYQHAAAVGASRVRLMVPWISIAKEAPTNPADPADPAYDWRFADQAVRGAVAHHQRLLLDITGAPAWAEGPNRQASAPPGTWKPDPEAFGAFAQAAATRYSGTYVDATGAVLPAVRDWQAWNEPNIYTNLNPQWVTMNGRATEFAPAHYRAMLNAFYVGVKGVSSANTIVTAGMAPYGDPGVGRRIMPVRFWRSLTCLAKPCSAPAKFDVAAHHPYGVRGPTSPALNADDAAVPDVDKIRDVIAKAVTRKRVSPARSKPMWVTEISWDSSPPDPDGIPSQRHARWLEQALYVLWKQGVSVVTWFRIVDEPPNPGYSSTSQSGVFLRNWQPKPAATAFRFPFVVERVGSSSVRLWGKSPRTGQTTVEIRSPSGSWRQLITTRPGSSHVFSVRAKLRGKAMLRARQGRDVSLTWSVGS